MQFKIMKKKYILVQDYWYPKRKMGANMHFSEIIKLQFEKERHTWLCMLKLFTNIVHELSLKNAWLPPIFFLISIALFQIYISRIIVNQGKNTFQLVGTVLNPSQLKWYMYIEFDISGLINIVEVGQPIESWE